jgi:CheY-like chemotaxis protein
MDIVCANCLVKFKLPDEKVPPNQAFSLHCPKCKEKITIDTRTPAGPIQAMDGVAAQIAKPLADDAAAAGYNPADRPFDFLEEGVDTALVCEQDAGLREKLLDALKAMGYHVALPQNAREALKQMRFHAFDLIVVNERFNTPDPDHNNILMYLERLGMETRRNMFVALLTDRFRTADNMAAFVKSVNVVIHVKNIDDFEKIIRKEITGNKAFYKVYKEAMKKAGRG